MNFLSWMIAIGLLLTLMFESLKLHEATVCRQEAWRSGTVLLTNELLQDSKSSDTLFSPRCQIFTQRNAKQVSWRRRFESHAFELKLQGKL